MLAMLACLFCEPPSTIQPPAGSATIIPVCLVSITSETLAKTHEQNLPMHLQAPALSLPYFANADMAESSVQINKSIAMLASPLVAANDMSTDYFSRVPTSGSSLTSGVQWQEVLDSSQPGTPYSTGNTPPVASKRASQYNSFEASLSSSPELAGRFLRKSTSQLTNALSNWTRPFSTNASTSPDDRHKQEPELSTSAPSGIKWGVTTIFSGASTPSPEKRRRLSRRNSGGFTFDDSAYNSSEEEDFDIIVREPSPKPKEDTALDIKQPRVRVTLLNQHQFDLEAQPSVLLLDPAKNGQYAVYREMYAEQLSIWGLDMKRAEVLKFNGLASLKHDASDRLSTTASSASIPSFAVRSYKGGDRASRAMSRSPSFQTVSPASMDCGEASSNTQEQVQSHVRIISSRMSSLTSMPASPSSGQTLMTPALTRLNPNAKVFTPTDTSALSASSLPAFITGLDVGGSDIDDEKVSKPIKPAVAPLCAICWEPTNGLYVLQGQREEGRYRAVHASCA